MIPSDWIWTWNYLFWEAFWINIVGICMEFGCFSTKQRGYKILDIPPIDIGREIILHVTLHIFEILGMSLLKQVHVLKNKLSLKRTFRGYAEAQENN